jgi:hypothetical protein
LNRGKIGTCLIRAWTYFLDDQINHSAEVTVL